MINLPLSNHILEDVLYHIPVLVPRTEMIPAPSNIALSKITTKLNNFPI